MPVYDLLITFLGLPLGSFLLYDRARRKTNLLVLRGELNLATGMVFLVYSVVSMIVLVWLRLGWSEVIGYGLGCSVIVGGGMMLVAALILYPYRLLSTHLGAIFIASSLYLLTFGVLVALSILGVVFIALSMLSDWPC